MEDTMGQLLRQIIQNFHKWKIPEPRPRRIEFPEFPRDVRKALVLMGMRRSGKTWILYEQMQKLLSQGIKKEQMLYINFEDDRLRGFGSGDSETLLQAYFELYPEYAERSDVYFFLDEVHVVSGWETFVRRLIDQEKMQIYVTGSSAKMLSRELATTLRGRSFALEVFPFSFREYLDAKGIDGPLSSTEEAAVRHHCRTYLQYGGFPETLELAPNLHRPLLQDYMSTVVFRDVVERHAFANPTIAKVFFLRCMRQLGSLLSVRKLFRNLKSEGQSVGLNRLYELLDYFEEAYALFAVPIFSFSEKQQQANPKKFYPVDPGILRAYSVKPDFDRGASLESAVFIQLRRGSEDIFYYHTQGGRKVDFVVLDPDGTLQLYQASLDLSDQETMDREVQALIEAGQELEIDRATVITWDYEKTLTTDAFTIDFIPFWKWASHLSS